MDDELRTFMKAEKRRVLTRAEIKAKKERRSRNAAAIALVLILVAVVAAYVAYVYLPQNPIIPTPSGLRAAIVDHLSLTFPNETFVETVNKTLTEAGYTVDYFSGENVTVDFYRDLPALNYRIIIFRVHSALSQENKPPLALFTSESYSQSRHVYDQLYDRLIGVVYRVGGQDQQYFGIPPVFVKLSMSGRFPNSTIIVMGCNGLTYEDMAEAFIEKGASVYVGFRNPVSASHTDQTTARLLQHYVGEGLTLKDSMTKTYEEVGPDPAYDSVMLYYPQDAGNQIIGKNAR